MIKFLNSEIWACRKNSPIKELGGKLEHKWIVILDRLNE